MANVYETGIHLALTGGAAEGIATLISRLAGANIAVGKLQKGLESLRPAVLGAVAAFAGFEGLKVFADIAKKGTELLNQQEQLGRQGKTNLEVLQLTRDAYEKIGRAVPTARADEFLKSTREMMSIAGPQASLATLEAMAQKALKVDALLSNTFGTKKEGEYYKLLRSTEMKGIATDPAKRESLIDSMFSYITAFGGKLTAQDYQTMARRSGAAWINMKPEALGPLSVAMADLGGSAAGTAMMTAYQFQQGAGVLSKQQADVLQKANMLDPSKVHKTGFGGGKLQLDPGAMVGSLDYAGNLPGWLKDVLIPHLKAAAHGDDALFKNMLSKALPNRNAQKMALMFSEPGFLDQIAKDEGLATRVSSINEAYQNFITKNPKGVEQAYEAQKASMIEAIGAPLMRAAIPVMIAVTEMFTSIGTFAAEHPDAITNIGVAFAGISTALLILGTAAFIGAIAGFLPGGIVTLGIVGLVAGVAAIAGIHWKDFNSGEGSAKGFRLWVQAIIDMNWPKATSGLESFNTKMLGLVGINWPKIEGYINGFAGSVSNLALAEWPQLTGFLDGLRSALGRLWDWVKSYFPDWLTGNASGGEGAGAAGAAGGGGVGAAGGGGGGFARGSGASMSSGVGRAAIAASKADTSADAQLIRKIAGEVGIDPDVAVAVAKSEGLGREWAGGDKGTSFGPLQAHFRSNIPGLTAAGQGDAMLAAGIDARDPAQKEKVIRWQLAYAKAHGWSEWHGAQRVGIGNQEGIRGSGGDTSIGSIPGGTPLTYAQLMIGHRPSDADLQAYVSGQHLDPRKEAWCAAFVGASLEKAGIKGSGSNMATSYLNWGTHVDPKDVRQGDVMVLGRGHLRPVPGRPGHVGIAEGPVDASGHVRITAGDSGGTVSHEDEAAGQGEFRRAPEKHTEIHTHLHLEGRQLAHVMNKYNAKMAQFPTQAPYFDGSRTFTSPDHNLATT